MISMCDLLRLIPGPWAWQEGGVRIMRATDTLQTLIQGGGRLDFLILPAMNRLGFWVGCHVPCLATGPCDRSARLLGRWALPLIQIRGSQTDVSSFAHERVPFGRRVLSSDPRPYPDAGGNVSHRRERRAFWQVRTRVSEKERTVKVVWQGEVIFPFHTPNTEGTTFHPLVETPGLSSPTSVRAV
jgi:hypothetical protein